MMVFCAPYALGWWRGMCCWVKGFVATNDTLDCPDNWRLYWRDWLVVLTCCFRHGCSGSCFVAIREEAMILWAVLLRLHTLCLGTGLLVRVVVRVRVVKKKGFDSMTGTSECTFDWYGWFFWWRTVIKLCFEMTFFDARHEMIFFWNDTFSRSFWCVTRNDIFRNDIFSRGLLGRWVSNFLGLWVNIARNSAFCHIVIWQGMITITTTL